MPTVDAFVVVPGSPAGVERTWYDTGRWREWVDGFEELVSLSGGWPQVGGTVHWRSFPTGRGSVTETVQEYEPASGQVQTIADDSIAATQTVTFAPQADGVEVSLTLRYAITKRSPLTPILERLFVNRAVRASLQETLERFSAACAAGE